MSRHRLDQKECEDFLSFFDSIGDDSELWTILDKKFNRTPTTNIEDEKLKDILNRICRRLTQFSKCVEQSNVTMGEYQQYISESLASINLYTLLFIIKGQYGIASEYLRLHEELTDQYPHSLIVDKLKKIILFNNKLIGFRNKTAELEVSKNEEKETKSLTFVDLYKQLRLLEGKQKDFYTHCFAEFRPEDGWRLFVDGRHTIGEHTGWIEWERKEPGSVKAMYTVWEYIKLHCNDSPTHLNEEVLLTIHKLATVSVNKLNEGTNGGQYRREHNIQFGLTVGSNASINGVIDLMHLVNQEFDKYRILPTADSKSLLQDGGSSLIWKSIINEPNLIAKEIETIMSRYNTSVANYYENEKNVNERNCIPLLYIIIDCVKSIELVHPFGDANCRTCYALLNLLLLQNKLPPTILHNPNCLDGFTVSELVDEVVKGMHTFVEIKSNANDPRKNDCNNTIINRALRKEADDEHIRQLILSYRDDIYEQRWSELVKDEDDLNENICRILQDKSSGTSSSIYLSEATTKETKTISELIENLKSPPNELQLMRLMLSVFLQFYHAEIRGSEETNKNQHRIMLKKLAYCYQLSYDAFVNKFQSAFNSSAASLRQ